MLTSQKEVVKAKMFPPDQVWNNFPYVWDCGSLPHPVI